MAADQRKPTTFDTDEKKLLITMLGREGTSHMQHGMHKEQMEFVARCFDLAAKVARTADEPPSNQGEGGRHGG
jgi:hypothetical protein